MSSNCWSDLIHARVLPPSSRKTLYCHQMNKAPCMSASSTTRLLFRVRLIRGSFSAEPPCARPLIISDVEALTSTFVSGAGFKTFSPYFLCATLAHDFPLLSELLFITLIRSHSFIHFESCLRVPGSVRALSSGSSPSAGRATSSSAFLFRRAVHTLQLIFCSFPWSL